MKVVWSVAILLGIASILLCGDVESNPGPIYCVRSTLSSTVCSYSGSMDVEDDTTWRQDASQVVTGRRMDAYDDDVADIAC